MTILFYYTDFACAKYAILRMKHLINCTKYAALCSWEMAGGTVYDVCILALIFER